MHSCTWRRNPLTAWSCSRYSSILINVIVLSDGGGDGYRNRSIFGLPLISPTSPIIFYQSLVITFCDSTYTAFLVPIGIAWKVGLAEISFWTVTDLMAGIIHHFLCNLEAKFYRWYLNWIVCGIYCTHVFCISGWAIHFSNQQLCF